MEYTKMEGAIPKEMASQKESNSFPNSLKASNFLAVFPSKPSQTIARMINQIAGIKCPLIDSMILIYPKNIFPAVITLGAIYFFLTMILVISLKLEYFLHSIIDILECKLDFFSKNVYDMEK